MKKTSAKILSISDLVQWKEKGELDLSPKYQRNSVWNETAKSYLMDTILRGLPIPPIFMRQTIDINTKSTYREIIDGQQRVRAILEFIITESFAIKASHNKEFGGMHYSELEADAKEQLLEYEILAEIVTEKDDSIVYDMFARLNSNNIVLNRQEIRNSKYWGEFKVLVYNESSNYRDFFLNNQLLTDKDCARMKDSELINSLLIVLLEGIVGETPNYVDNIYNKYDKAIVNREELIGQFSKIMDVCTQIYEYLNGTESCFNNKNYFFTLYCAVLNQMYGIKNEILQRNEAFSADCIFDNLTNLFDKFALFINDFESHTQDKGTNWNDAYDQFSLFVKYHSTRTTGKYERTKRIEFLNSCLCNL